MKKIFSIAAIVALSMMVFSCKNNNEAAEATEEETEVIDSTAVEAVDSTAVEVVEEAAEVAETPAK